MRAFHHEQVCNSTLEILIQSYCVMSMSHWGSYSFSDILILTSGEVSGAHQTYLTEAVLRR